MPRLAPIQESFNAGEWSPRMLGRTDISKYASAAARLKNYQITPQGAAMVRPGGRYVAEQANSALAGRLIPFVFSDEQAYVLLFEHLQIRIFRNEGELIEQTIPGFRAGSGVDIHSEQWTIPGGSSHSYSDGAGPVRISTDDTLPTGIDALDDYFIILPPTRVFHHGDVEATAANTIDMVDHGYSDQMGPFHLTTSVALPPGLTPDTDYYIIKVDDDSFQLETSVGNGAETITGVGVGTHTLAPTNEYVRTKFRLGHTATGPIVQLQSTGQGTHTLTPQSPSALLIASPFTSADLSGIGFAQSADVLYLVHRNHPPQKLERFAAGAFQINPLNFIDGPYLAENVSAVTITPSSLTGTAVLTASETLFDQLDVGRLIRIENDPAPTPQFGYAQITSVNPVTFLDAAVETETFLAAAINTATDEITITTHTLETGELVTFDAATTNMSIDGSPITPQDPYYVRVIDANTISLHPTEADASANTNKEDITAIGVGPFTLTSSRITIAGHGYSGGEGPLQASSTVLLPTFGGTAPVATQQYWIVEHDADTFSLAFAATGPPQHISAATAGGTHSLGGGNLPSKTCTATVKAAFKDTTATTVWRFWSWGDSPDLGYPRAVAFQEQRLWFTSNPGAPQTIYASKSADFEGFSPTGDVTGEVADLDDSVDDDNAIVFTIGATQVNVIQWLTPVRTLLMGTTGSNWTAAAALVSEAISPTNLQVRRSGAHGSAPLHPIVVDDRVLYVSDTRLKLFTLGYSFDADAYLSEDLTLLAEHITRSGIIDIDFAHEPWSTAWCPRADGHIAALTIVRNQEILGWAEHEIGGSYVAAYGLTIDSVDITANTLRTTTDHALTTGDRIRFLGATLPPPLVEHRDYYVRVADADDLSIHATEEDATEDQSRISLTATGTGTLGPASAAVVESVAVIPSPDGDASAVGRVNRSHDQVWLLVKRTVNGAVKRYVEFVEDHFEDDEDPTDAFYLDAGITYNSTATTSISGLTHLAGETVNVLADGVALFDQVVSTAGVLTLANAASLVHIGYGYNADIGSLRLALPDPEGTSQAKLGRIDHLVLRLHASMGGQFGPDAAHLEDLDLTDPDQLLDEVPAPFTGDIEVAFDGPWETEASFFIRQNHPLPFTVLAVLPVLQKSGRGDRA